MGSAYEYMIITRVESLTLKGLSDIDSSMQASCQSLIGTPFAYANPLMVRHFDAVGCAKIRIDINLKRRRM